MRRDTGSRANDLTTPLGTNVFFRPSPSSSAKRRQTSRRRARANADADKPLRHDVERNPAVGCLLDALESRGDALRLPARLAGES
jgi:hypothetical protein